MAEVFDAMVVGLGPAGAAAAVELARAGARVMVFHRPHQRAKPCGGSLSLRATRVMEFLGLPAWVFDQPADRLFLTAPGRPAAFSAAGQAGAFFIERGRLDDLLRQRTLEAGARVTVAGAKALRRQDGLWLVSSSAGDFASRWLLGADGAGGLLGRALGLGRTSYVFRALVEERPLPAGWDRGLAGSALLELGAAPGGYAWVFLREGVMNLGLAGRAPLSTARLLECYAAFLKRRGLGRPGAWRGWLIPCAPRRPPRLALKQAAVVGDAAALADPFLGEGIGQAVMSGRLAARAVAAGDLSLYAREIGRTLLREHGHARRLAGLIHGAPRFFQGLAREHPRACQLAWQVLRGERGFSGIWAGVAALGLGLPQSAGRWGLDRPLRDHYSKHLM